MEERICEQCYELFEAKEKSSRFCSISCSSTYNNKKLREEKLEKYYLNPKICELESCDNIIEYEQRNSNRFCSRSCAAKFNNKKFPRKPGPEQTVYPFTKVKFAICEETGKPYLLTTANGGRRQRSPYIKLNEKQEYYEQAQFQFNVFHYPDEFNLSLIEEYGWYSTPGSNRNGITNADGVSRDHMLSISEGFRLKIDPKLIAHPANCRLIKQRENIAKRGNSSITLDQLKGRINLWGEKY